jgi:hypothetical protein
MEAEKLIPLEEIIRQHEIDIYFIDSIRESGFVQVVVVEEKEFVSPDQMSMLEKMIRLHHELDINVEGVEAISYLLMRMEKMQEELTVVKNRLRLYE